MQLEERLQRELQDILDNAIIEMKTDTVGRIVHLYDCEMTDIVLSKPF